MQIKCLIQLMRPKHWIKNTLVLLPIVFSGGLGDPDVLVRAVFAFVSFCLIASAVYVINDLKDAERDRAHPVKCKRPIASGAVSRKAALVLTAVLFCGAALLQIPMGSFVPGIVLVVYVAVNLAYSAKLKEVPVADVFLLAAGYVIRVYYGGLACDINISSWMYLTVLSGSFYMGMGKRRGELACYGEESRPVLKRYNVGFLDKNMYMFLGMANVFYALWARDAAHGMLVTVPIVMLLSLRYSLDVEGASDGDPMEVILSDRWLIAFALLLAITAVALVYFPR